MRYALALAALFATTAMANAATIITFGQTSGANTITGVANSSGTHLSGSDIGLTITQIDSGAVTPPTAAFLDFSADSSSGATTGLVVVQHYAGTFSINSAADNSGTDFLSGTFADGVFGIKGGTGLTLTADGIFASDVISVLGAPRDLSLSFTNVSPPLGTSAAQAENSADCGPPFTVGCNDTGATIAAFTASVSGNASATVPEPMTLGLMGVGLLGLTLVRRRAH